MNSWSMLYDELNMGKEDFAYTATGEKWVKDTGGYEWTPLPPKEYLDSMYPDIPDNFTLPIVMNENQNGFWKYQEDKTLKEIEQYLTSTYHQHYTSQESKTQTLDLIESIGDAEPFTRSNAIKYLSRFGKKGGKSRLDILKAIHYCILLYHFSGLHNERKDTYETF